jgi:hypothetical protein
MPWLALLFTAADLTGIWHGEIAREKRDPLEVAFQFQQSGTQLSGKQYGDFKSMRIVEGSVTGPAVRFVVIAEEQSGNQINETRWRYAGEWQDGELELTREREQSRAAGTGGEAGGKPAPPQKLRLKRLL